ncbi:MAG: NAD(P)H-hydrate epimerase [Candidatus Woesearchaeota archaeon]|nr:NAD(P)H-hydrate epimerase [Candidatus Woesearchaeota archaeon]
MITTKEMQALEASCGIPTLELMRNAGTKLAEELVKRWPGGKILFVCYHGNNGGDGFVAARLLGADVWFVGDKNKLTPAAKANFHGLTLVTDPDLSSYDVLVDALLGTGTTGELREPLASLCSQWHAAAAAKVAVDIPTGVDPDTGVAGKFFSCECVITFYDTKPGLATFNNVVVVDIGIC